MENCKTTTFLIALALASTSPGQAFVSQSPAAATRAVGADTQLNALWRHWIPQTTDMMDLMVDKKKNSNREFVVTEPLDENDVGLPATEKRTVSLVSNSKDASSSSSASNYERSPGFWAATAAAALFVASSAVVPASLAVSGGGLDFAGLDISNQDFSKGNYKGKDFTQVLARNTNFAGSNLLGCRMPKAYLINANFEGADIRGVSFEGTNLENTNLKVSDMTDIRKFPCWRRNKQSLSWRNEISFVVVAFVDCTICSMYEIFRCRFCSTNDFYESCYSLDYRLLDANLTECQCRRRLFRRNHS